MLEHTKPNDGGLAFPKDDQGGGDHGAAGMTMRQYYKGAVIQGLMGNGGVYPGQAVASNVPENMAYLVGMIADAMIAEDEDFLKG